MKYTILTVLFFMIFHATVFAQNPSDSIEIRISAGVKYYQNGNKLTQRQILAIMKSDNIAYNEMLTAKSNSEIALILGATGGFLIGYQIGKRIAGSYPNRIWSGVGGVLILVSIPLTIQSGKHAKNAVRIYNDGLKQTAFHKVEYRIELNSNGLGVSMRF